MMRAGALVAIFSAGCYSEFVVHEITGAFGMMSDTGARPGPIGRDTDIVWVVGPDQDTSPPTGADTPEGEGSTPSTVTGTSAVTDTGVVTDTSVDGPVEDDCETAAAVAGYLDAWQIAGDDRVFFCHNGSGANWVFLDASISSCLPHLDHAFDVFPTTGCDT